MEFVPRARKNYQDVGNIKNIQNNIVFLGANLALSCFLVLPKQGGETNAKNKSLTASRVTSKTWQVKQNQQT